MYRARFGGESRCPRRRGEGNLRCMTAHPAIARAGLRRPVRAAAAALALLLAAPQLGGAAENGLFIAMPEAWVEAGLDRHLLPRFGFKTRLRLQAAPSDGAAALALVPLEEAPQGAPAVMADADGRAWAVAPLRDDAEAEGAARELSDWLRSASGRRALESFEIDGEPAFIAGAAARKEPEPIRLEGDTVEGARLARLHCGRCHVIDGSNPFAGIGSTPSFGAMRSLPDWRSKFVAFHTLNPHPAFTVIEGVTPPFDPQRPPPIAPVRMTLEEAEAIAAYAATIPPKDLGSRVQAR
jgi:mono/diheme cytochrome c family protein